jgi:hypothetical protein
MVLRLSGYADRFALPAYPKRVKGARIDPVVANGPLCSAGTASALFLFILRNFDFFPRLAALTHMKNNSCRRFLRYPTFIRPNRSRMETRIATVYRHTSDLKNKPCKKNIGMPYLQKETLKNNQLSLCDITGNRIQASAALCFHNAIS